MAGKTKSAVRTASAKGSPVCGARARSKLSSASTGDHSRNKPKQQVQVEREEQDRQGGIQGGSGEVSEEAGASRAYRLLTHTAGSRELEAVSVVVAR